MDNNNQQAGHELISMTYTWTIDNFSKLKTQKHYSDGFVVGDFKWRIVVYPKGSNGKQYLSMYLNVADASKLPSGWSRYAEFTLTVVNQFNSDKSITIDTQHQFSAKKSDWGFTSFMPLSELFDQNEGYIVDDICIVEAEVAVSKADIKVLKDQETAFLEQELQSQSSDVDSVKYSESSTAHTSLCYEQMLAFQDALNSDPVQTNVDSVHVPPLKIEPRSDQVLPYQETDSPVGPPIVEESDEAPSTPVSELINFRGLGKIDKAFVPLLEEVCLWHPSLISCQRKRSRMFSEWAFTALLGLDQLRSGLLQQQKPFIQAPQPFHQLQMLTPQHQQQLMLAQQNLTSPSASDDSRRLRMLLNNRSMGLGKDGLSNSVGDVVPNVGSPLQAPGSMMPRGDTDMLMKLKMAQLQQQQNSNPQQQLQQHALSAQQLQSSNHNPHQQDKMGGAGSITMDASMSNSFRGNDQVTKNQPGRKRKQPVSSSGPANSTGTANTAGPSPSSAPSTPSTHTPGDVISMPALPHSGGSSKPLMMFGADGTGTLTSPSNPLADMDRFVEDGSLDDNVESFLSHDDADPRDAVGRGMDVSKGFTFTEVNSVKASPSKVTSCHFSSDGKLLTSGGHDKKAVLWYTDTLKSKSTLEEHSALITDVRFSPSIPRLATSSFDKTVRVWDADNPGYSLRTFMGHTASVMSVDFHPNKDDLICSCDGDGEIRYWSINNGSCARVFKGGTTQVRFQPRLGRYLAAAAENIVSILDVESQACRHSLQGHTKPINSVCWDPSGEFLASLSEDFVKVWTFGSGNEGACVHELNCNGNKFHSCVFHPTYTSLLVVGCYQSLELWNMQENKTMTLSAHEGLIASLAVSTVTGLVASASHDKWVKLWK